MYDEDRKCGNCEYYSQEHPDWGFCENMNCRHDRTVPKGGCKKHEWDEDFEEHERRASNGLYWDCSNLM